MKHAYNIVIESFHYFEKTIYNTKGDGFESKLHDDMVIYYLCSFMDPISFRAKYTNECPDFDDTILEYINGLNIFTSTQISDMRGEWKNYWRKVQTNIEPTTEDGKPKYRMAKAQSFWKEFEASKLPNLAMLARYAFLVPPSSAAAERVFSVLKHSLSLVQMHQALEDRTEIQCKMRYNHRNERLYEVMDPSE